MHILDGYNRRAVLRVGQHDVRLMYRPFHSSTSPERKRLQWEIGFLGRDAAQAQIDQMLFRQVVSWDLPQDVSQIGVLRSTNEPAYNQFLKLLFGHGVDASGEKWMDVESVWASNLRGGVILDRLDHRLANRSCEDCQTYWYQDNGLVLLRNSTGEKELRPMFALPSCRTEFGCPKGTPENQKSLNIANQWAWRYFQACEVTSSFPDDDIVRYNARVIRKAIEKAEKLKTNRMAKIATGFIGSFD